MIAQNAYCIKCLQELFNKSWITSKGIYPIKRHSLWGCTMKMKWVLDAECMLEYVVFNQSKHQIQGHWYYNTNRELSNK